jgi:VCBS repeat-containing protein
MSKLPIRFAVLAIWSVLLISACSKNSSSPVTPNNSGAFFPIAIGNVWKMQNWSINGSFQLAITDTTSMNVQKDTTIAGEKWFTTGDGSYLTLKSTGVWNYDTDNGAQLFFKYPASVNDTYTIYTGSDSNKDTMTVKVTSLAQTATVPAGTFSCYAYQLTPRTPSPFLSSITYLISPGVGMIQMTSDGINPLNNKPMTFSKMALLSYTLK